MFSKYIKTLECIGCGKHYAPADIDYVCPDHTEQNRLQVLYDFDAICAEWSKDDLARNPERTIRRYAPLLPLSMEALSAIPYHVGGTPLIKAPALEEASGVSDVYIKYDAANPSGSLKDRASFIVTALAKASNRPAIAAASSGNAASSLAALCAAAGTEAILFVPKAIPQAKLTQIAIYGAKVFVVEGSYDQAFALCAEACEEFSWYSRNTGFNPYTREGKKTVAFEIAEQLDWNAPDWVLVPVGDGCILSGVHKGFKDLLDLGWINKMPRLAAIQAEGAPSLHHAFTNDLDTPQFIEAHSDIDSINVGLPGDGDLALRALKETNGHSLTMTDDEMRHAMNDLARLQGVLSCTAGSSGWGALQRMREEKLVNANDKVVILSTGHGMKDLQHFASHDFKDVKTVQPDLGALKEHLKE